MFEPQKLITVAIALVLLTPFGYVFWLVATHRPRPEAQVRAELEARLRESAAWQTPEQITTNRDGTFAITGPGIVGVGQVEAIFLSPTTKSWLSFFPRLWVGVFGLLAVVCIVACLIILLFFPRCIEVWASDSPIPSPAPVAPK